VSHTPTIAVDFDGCLCEHKFPDCGPPMVDVVALLRHLDEDGWKIIIHSCRCNSDWVGKGASEAEARAKVDDMLMWLDQQDIPYTSVWGIVILNIGRVTNPAWDYSGVSGKPVADVYLDDRAIDCSHKLTHIMRAEAYHKVRAGGDPLAFHRSLGRAVD